MFELVRRLLVAGIALGAIAGNADEIQRFFDDAVAASQSLTTAADLRGISAMLDYEYMKRGRYPATDGFADWMKSAFKENPAGVMGNDHWGNPLVYRASADRKGYRLVSAGLDGIVGTSDDMTYTGP